MNPFRDTIDMLTWARDNAVRFDFTALILHDVRYYAVACWRVEYLKTGFRVTLEPRY